MPKLSRTGSSSDLEALLKTQNHSDGGGGGTNKSAASGLNHHHDKEFVSLKRRAKLKQQEKYGRIRLGILVLAIFFIIFLSFVSNSRTYQPKITVIVPHDIREEKPKNVSLDAHQLDKTNKKSLQPQPLHSLSPHLSLSQTPPPPPLLLPAITENVVVTLNTATTSKLMPSTISTTTTARYNSSRQKLIIQTYNQTVPHGYLIYGPECKIPDIDPLEKDVMRLYHPEEHRPCSSQPPLTYVRQDWEHDTVTLHLNFSAVSSYLSVKKYYLECCYQEIHRAGEYTHADDKFNLTTCRSFDDQNVTLPKEVEFILVKCKKISHKKPETVYTNAHALIRQRPEVVARQAQFTPATTPQDDATPGGGSPAANVTRPLSILLVGIDSVSRLNLIRAMPHTAQHLYNTGWMELKGYNKIGDNTFPNLMAILTGLNNTQAYHECDPKKVGKLNECPFVWRQFQDLGYATAYAEDEASISSFNYHKYGFLTKPVDHYFRPFALAAEKYLRVSKESGLKICLGYQNYADHIYQYALDFGTQYRGKPYFGLFWTNTFSHNDISSISSMDLKMKEYIVKLNETGILDDALVIFFSDHGMRFGKVRQLLTGWFEERLPFIFFSFPPWFNETYPEFVQNFKTNRNRLTTPYEFHLTMKHIASLAGSKTEITSDGCPKCQSLFEELPYNRSCVEAAIDQHWCTCIPYMYSDKSMPEVREAVNAALHHINDDLKGQPKCAKLRLKKILSAKIAKTEKMDAHYLVTFDVYPSGAQFEATLRYVNETYKLTGSISRLNEYGKQSECVNDDKLKKYCMCNKK